MQVENPLDGYSMTAAPLVVKDTIVLGIGGGEYGIRGFVDAYDAETGERRWRVYTVPGPGEPGHETWAGHSWATGGASTWMTGSYDPDLNLIYWGVGNPGPDWNGETRRGDNLYSDSYSDSVIAIDADTGSIKWHFQFTPHDVHDWDACQVPVLVDTEFCGRERKLMLWANRNGFFYVLDRETGQFLLGEEYAEQTWAQGLDDSGRPIREPNMEPSREGRFVAPEVNGASNWWSPSFSPQTNLFYTMAYDGGAMFFTADAEYEPGKLFVGGSYTRTAPIDTYVNAVRAIDPKTGQVAWEHRVQPKSMSGVMATAGGLVFAGTIAGNFIALDAETGDDLWHMPLGEKSSPHRSPTERADASRSRSRRGMPCSRLRWTSDGRGQQSQRDDARHRRGPVARSTLDHRGPSQWGHPGRGAGPSVPGRRRDCGNRGALECRTEARSLHTLARTRRAWRHGLHRLAGSSISVHDLSGR